MRMRIRLSYFTIILFVLLASACTSEYDQTFNGSRRAETGKDVVFYATIESPEDVDAQTKVYADAQMRVLWNAGDRISIFNKNTYNQPYRFKGDDGDNAGGFEKVSTDDEFSTDEPMSHIYAVYPYNTSTKISYDDVMTVNLSLIHI